MITLKAAFVCLFCARAFTKTINHNEENVGPLNLTPYVEKGQFEEARKASAVDPKLFAGTKSHAAYFTVNKTLGWNTFFWYFPVEGQDESTPWLIWLQGGPGGSSLYGLFTEIGPIQIVNGEAQKMDITWGSNYSLLFIDNPVGTGFSYTTSKVYCKDQDDVGSSLLNFLQQFLEVFPMLRKAPLFLAGESYAGKYIPAFGHYIHNNKDTSKPINLKGLAIGDGWTDPPTLMFNAEYGLANGFLSIEDAVRVEELESRAREYWEKNDLKAYREVAGEGMYILWGRSTYSYNYLAGIMKTPESDEFELFLNRAEVQIALHVGKRSYTCTNQDVYKGFMEEFYLSVKPWLEEMLEHYGVMCYSGQLDILVAYPLSMHTYYSLIWSGKDDYYHAPRQSLGKYGYLKTAGNFLDVMVRGAGHMVPFDQPEFAKYFIDLFIKKFKN